MFNLFQAQFPISTLLGCVGREVLYGDGTLQESRLLFQPQEVWEVPGWERLYLLLFQSREDLCCERFHLLLFQFCEMLYRETPRLSLTQWPETLYWEMLHLLPTQWLKILCWRRLHLFLLHSLPRQFVIRSAWRWPLLP